MSRDVPFDVDDKCESCGAQGAYDFTGDTLCVRCVGAQDEHPDIADPVAAELADLLWEALSSRGPAQIEAAHPGWFGRAHAALARAHYPPDKKRL